MPHLTLPLSPDGMVVVAMFFRKPGVSFFAMKIGWQNQHKLYTPAGAMISRLGGGALLAGFLFHLFGP